jgi:hypothetical protein
MKLAFYAPLKPPDHATPSGDRAMARAIIAALEHAGAKVELASRLRSREGTGDQKAQSEIAQQAQSECERLNTLGHDAGWQAWVTYHNYYKAPDLIGPPVAQALNIPYLQIESTRAQKRLGGPWHDFAVAAEAASDAADVIFHVTQRDAIALRRDAPVGQHLIHLHPFLARTNLPRQSKGHTKMLSVGMMRPGDKLASYELIAETLALLPANTWQLHIAGDGPARAQVETLMVPFGTAVTFLGKLDQPALADAYHTSALLFWPGVNEAFGLTYLEAQAAGVPVVAQDRPGVRDVLAPGQYPTEQEGAAGLATLVSALLSDPEKRRSIGATARAHVAAHHLLPAASKTLAAGLAAVGITL